MSQKSPTLPSKSPAIGREYSIPYEREVDFDLTTFPDPESFTDLCTRHGLTDTHQIDELTRDGIKIRYWHWYNDKVLLITCVNPITGEWKHPSGEIIQKEPGFASHVMLKGSSDAVIELYEDIVTTVGHIKAGEVHEAQITADGTHNDCTDRYPKRLKQFREAEFDKSQL